jgi:hypothetical protein
MSIDWEYLGEQSLPPGTVAPWRVQTWRVGVPGGWLILVINHTPDKSTGLTFYPDATHGWNGRSLPAMHAELDSAGDDIETGEIDSAVAADESTEDQRFWSMQRFEDEDNKR